MCVRRILALNELAASFHALGRKHFYLCLFSKVLFAYNENRKVNQFPRGSYIVSVLRIWISAMLILTVKLKVTITVYDQCVIIYYFHR